MNKNAVINVLHVDDEPGILDITKQFLEQDPAIAVDTAISAAKAFEMIEEKVYDVVISDYQMPDMDGIQFLKELRTNGDNVPFILFTGRGREEVVIEALNNGANFYLQKGFDAVSQFAELSNMIKKSNTARVGERALMISEGRFNSLFETSNDAIIQSKLDGTVLCANPSALKMLDMTEDEIKKAGFVGILENDINFTHAVQRLKHRNIVKSEFVFKRNDDTNFTGETSLGLFTGSDGEGRVSMLIRDVTKNTEFKLRLEASELRYRRLFETAQDGILILDFETEKVIDANPFILNLTGYSMEDAVGKHLWEFGFIEDRSLAERAFHELRTVGYVRYENIPLKKKNGDTIAVEFISNVYKVKDSNIVQCNIRDVTERQLLHRKILELSRIVDFSDDAIIGLGLDGTITSWNRGAEKIFGYPMAEAIGRSISLLTDKYSKDDMLETLNQALSEESLAQLITSCLTKREDTIYIILTASPVLNEQGRIDGSSIIAKDVTDRVRAQTALFNANLKLNLLSSVTRHDINNQVTVLNGFLSLAQKGTKDPTLLAQLDKMAQAAANIQKHIGFTKDYQDLGVKAPIWSNVHQQAQEAFNMLRPKGVLLENRTEGVIIWADPLIKKVFYNLIDNSMRHGGQVTRIIISNVIEGRNLVLSYEDDGKGIRKESMEKIFTNGERNGSGLGLLLVRDILAITGITIKATGDGGPGARFEMLVPAKSWRIRDVAEGKA